MIVGQRPVKLDLAESIGATVLRRRRDQHRGRIRLDSEPGQCTTFHFTFGQTQVNGSAS